MFTETSQVRDEDERYATSPESEYHFRHDHLNMTLYCQLLSVSLWISPTKGVNLLVSEFGFTENSLLICFLSASNLLTIFFFSFQP
jgi:hypothetical protein